MPWFSKTLSAERWRAAALPHKAWAAPVPLRVTNAKRPRRQNAGFYADAV